ncbi:MAG: iron-containing alcohol dehydrogenase [Proteobacteria bacterium]|nr:iron-containing alcohol dehydrogenase [Pseudomonadota bacterium]
MIQQFNYPTMIKFGAGAIKLVPQTLKQRGAKRPLIVTDRDLAVTPMVGDLQLSLSQVGLIPAVFGGATSNPVETQVKEGVAAYHEHGGDCLVIIGGGAALDVGKSIALMINHPGHLFNYEEGRSDGRPVDQPIPFMIAVPTTAGTGSEVGRSMVIADAVSHVKRIIFDPKLLPPLVIADPELTYGLPAAMTAAVGFDALTHNIEAFLAHEWHPIADGIALEGVRLIALNLLTAVREPTNLTARGGMQMASIMGAVASQKGLGVTHSCAHALSSVFDTHHGLANAIMLEPCMEFNRACCEERLARLGQAVMVPATNTSELASGFMRWLRALKHDVGLPPRLGPLDATTTARLVEVAAADPCHTSNPRPVSRNDFADIFAHAM